MHLKLSGTGVI